jgi:hypothetical protein
MGKEVVLPAAPFLLAASPAFSARFLHQQNVLPATRKMDLLFQEPSAATRSKMNSLTHLVLASLALPTNLAAQLVPLILAIQSALLVMSSTGFISPLQSAAIPSTISILMEVGSVLSVLSCGAGA